MAKLVIKSATIKVEVIPRGDEQAARRRPEEAVTYLYDLHAKLGELVGLKKTAAFAKIAKQAFEYNESLGKVFNAVIDSGDETLRRYQSLKTNLITQARRLSKQIEQMEAFVQTCTPEPEMRLP